MNNKPTLIILPGWGGNELLWEHQCQHLSDLVDPKVIVITQHKTTEKMIEEIMRLAPEKFILLGHSLGGWLAQQIAINYPDRITKLMLVGTSTGSVNSEFSALLTQMSLRIKKGEAENLIDELRPTIVAENRSKDVLLLQQIKLSQAKFPAEGLLNQNETVIHFKDTAPDSEKINCPTLVIYGRQDSFFTMAEQDAMVKHIPQAKLAIIDDCGHMVSVERPEALTALVRLWIQL